MEATISETHIRISHQRRSLLLLLSKHLSAPVPLALRTPRLRSKFLMSQLRTAPRREERRRKELWMKLSKPLQTLRWLRMLTR